MGMEELVFIERAVNIRSTHFDKAAAVISNSY
jgi:hypothetical protein